MSELANKSNIGVQSQGDAINWRRIDEKRIDDPIISALVKESQNIFIENRKLEILTKDDKILNIYLESFNNFLKANKFKFVFSLAQSIVKDAGKGKKPNKKEITLNQIKEDKIKKNMSEFILSLEIINHIPTIENNNMINAFFNVLFWAIYLLQNKKLSIDLTIYLNCVISLYRAINDSSNFLSQELTDESFAVLNSLEELLQNKIPNEKLFDFITNNQKFILDSLWDNAKPNSISLYKEQKDIISLVTSNLNEKKLIFFEMPPANGKTILSAILAKVIAHMNKENREKKTLLYICYNSIVRNEVAKLCITHNVDCKYWLAVTDTDKEDQKIKTFLRPHKSSYPDWNRKGLRTKKEDAEYKSRRWMKFSENIRDQWNFFIDETRPVSQQLKYDIDDYENAENIPEMIICDLESAYRLLKEFPNKFITYFDEAFAASELMITSKIMSVLGFTVLVSATLAKPEEIPTVIADFKERHKLTDDSHIHVIKSNKQHISCTFIDPIGNIFAPHNNVSDLESFRLFIDKLETPLIKRAYSPEVVFNMSSQLDIHLPIELKFKTVFKYLGNMTHESLRDYACNILRYIADYDDNDLFQVLQSVKHQKIVNMDVNTMFTESAIHYHDNKTLHVATSNNFNQHVEQISEPFLRNSPKLSDMYVKYDREYKILNDELQSLEKNGKKESEHEKQQLKCDIANLKLTWDHQFLLNSDIHAHKFRNLYSNIVYNKEIHGTKEDLDMLDDTIAKLYLSEIGVYQPEEFSSCKMDLFLKNKDNFKFILSTPSIVYGTNISLSIIDIDSSFIIDSTKNRLYQLIGRAGRRGISSSATAIFRDMRMLNMILDDDFVNIEAIQIEDNFRIVKVKELEEQEKK